MIHLEKSSPAKPPPAPLAASRILVVDDNPDVLAVYARLLTRSGYEVWTASNGQEGLAVARARRPDVVLLDVMLPDLSGIEVCRQIKAEASLQDVFVVLISGGATSVDHKVDGLDRGADEYLTKPVEPDEFLARMRTIVRLQETTAALRNSEQHYRTLVEILPDAVCLVELTGKLLTINSQALTMLGYANSTELLERNLFDLFLPADQLRVKADLAILQETGAPLNAEYLMLHKNGAPISVELNAVRLKDNPSAPLRLVVVVRDITLRKRTEEESRRLPQRVIDAQEAERHRVARELHDGVNQIIASAKMRLCKVANTAGVLSSAAREMLARCDKQLLQVLEENRRIARNLSPSDLDELGLAEACSNLCNEVQRRTNIAVQCQFSGTGQRLPPKVELNLFRIVQEAINNAEKHSGAKTIRLSITHKDHEIILEIQDDGRGFDLRSSRSKKSNGHGLGLSNVRQRAALLGGACKIESLAGQGTTITVRADLRQLITTPEKP